MFSKNSNISFHLQAFLQELLVSEEESLRSNYANVNPALEQCERDESHFNGILEGDDMPSMSDNIQALSCKNTTTISMEVII